MCSDPRDSPAAAPGPPALRAEKPRVWRGGPGRAASLFRASHRRGLAETMLEPRAVGIPWFFQSNGSGKAACALKRWQVPVVSERLYEVLYFKYWLGSGYRSVF